MTVYGTEGGGLAPSSERQATYARCADAFVRAVNAWRAELIWREVKGEQADEKEADELRRLQAAVGAVVELACETFNPEMRKIQEELGLKLPCPRCGQEPQE